MYVGLLTAANSPHNFIATREEEPDHMFFFLGAVRINVSNAASFFFWFSFGAGLVAAAMHPSCGKFEMPLLMSLLPQKFCLYPNAIKRTDGNIFILSMYIQ